MAAARLAITITADHLRAGRPRAAWRCPLALALQAQLGSRWSVTAQVAQLFVYNRPPWRWYLTPEAAAWVQDWDAGKTMQEQVLVLTSEDPVS